MNQIRGQFDVQSGSSSDEAGEDFYALLGLKPFESNTSTISARARDLMRDARKYQVGPRAADAQVKLERLAMASACLLDPSQKVTYDNALRDRFGLPPISIRSEYVPKEHLGDNQSEIGNERRILSPRLALVMIIVLAIVAVIISQQFQYFGASADGVAPAGKRDQGPFHAQLAPPADQPASMPTGRPGDDAGRKGVAAGAIGIENGTPAVVPRSSSEPPNAGLAPKRAPAESPQSPRVNAASSDGREDDAALADPEGPLVIPPSTPKPRAHAAQPPAVAPTGFLPASGQGQNIAPAVQISSVELLRQLREFRLKRSPAMRMSLNPQTLGAQRVVELVQYGRTAFSDDRRFQRQLDQEVNALRRLYAPFRDVLPEPEH